MKVHNCVLGAMAAIGWSFAANASPIFNSVANSTSTGNFNTTVSTSVVADSFTTGSSGLVSEIEVALNKGSNTNGSTLITLWSVSGTPNSLSAVPGSLVGTVGTVLDNSLASTATKYLIDFTGLPFALSASTEYFVEISHNGTGSSTKYLNNSAAPAVGASEVFFKNTTSSVGAVTATSTTFDFPEAQICVSADGSCAGLNVGNGTLVSVAASAPVPEPASLSILGAGLTACGLLVVNRRRRRSA